MKLTEWQQDVADVCMAHYGREAQTIKAIEELAELVVVLARSRNQAVHPASIQEEIADVIVMVGQMRAIWGASEVDEWIQRKMIRMAQRLGLPVPQEEGSK